MLDVRTEFSFYMYKIHQWLTGAFSH
ncbi:hypothetical protein SSYM_1698, partial [Serratia symbiotica str. Tucson]